VVSAGGAFWIALVSALIPLVNIEAYLGAVALTSGGPALWLIAMAAALGQMLGKLVWFYAGRRSMDWAWVNRKLASEKSQRRLRLWTARVETRPWAAAALVLGAGLIGLPPLAIVSVLAGQLSMAPTVFLCAGLVGRFGRFAALLMGISLLPI